MKEYKIVINNQEFIIKQDYDGKFIKPDFIKEYEKVGSALKPSFEPIIVARKPFKGSLVDNVIEYGVGGINVDECRVGTTGATKRSCQAEYPKKENGTEDRSGHWARTGHEVIEINAGRFPANTILTYDETDFDEVCGGFPNSKGKGHFPKNNKNGSSIFNTNNLEQEEKYISDSGSASRYFMNCKYTGKDEEIRRYIYTPKASKKDRDEGLDDQAEVKVNDGRQTPIDNPFQRGETPRKNTHCCVKPTSLMQYLVRLVTPNNGTILDPFNGSGSTGKAVMYENKEKNKNYKYIGIELTEEYLPISKARIEYVCNLIEEEKTKDKQLSIFDEEDE